MTDEVKEPTRRLRPARAWPVDTLVSVIGLNGTYKVAGQASLYGVWIIVDGESQFVGTESLLPPINSGATELAAPARTGVSGGAPAVVCDPAASRGAPVEGSGVQLGLDL